jgi:peptide/nickel transport system permease protein
LAEVVLAEETQEIVQRTPKQIAWGRFKRNKVGVFAGYATLFFLTCSILAPLITRAFGVDNQTIYSGVLNEFAMPKGAWGGISWQHPLGLEPGVGRDVFALLLYGSQLSFLVAFISTFAAIAIGMLLSLIHI